MGMILVAGGLWSFQALVIRQIHAPDAWAVLMWRSIAMAPVLTAFLAWRSGWRPLAAIRRTGLAGRIGGLGLVIATGGAILAFQTTTVANAAVLLAASPFLAVLRDTCSPRRIFFTDQPWT